MFTLAVLSYRKIILSIAVPVKQFSLTLYYLKTSYRVSHLLYEVPNLSHVLNGLKIFFKDKIWLVILRRYKARIFEYVLARIINKK